MHTLVLLMSPLSCWCGTSLQTYCT